jgi:hypothetical protein
MSKNSMIVYTPMYVTLQDTLKASYTQRYLYFTQRVDIIYLCLINSVITWSIF